MPGSGSQAAAALDPLRARRAGVWLAGLILAGAFGGWSARERLWAAAAAGLCADGALEPFTRFQVGASFFILVFGAAGMAWGWAAASEPARRRWTALGSAPCAKAGPVGRIPVWLAALVLAVFGLVPFVLYVAACLRPPLMAMFKEGGWMEASTAVTSLGAAALFAWSTRAVRGVRRATVRSGARGFAPVLAAGGFLLLALEEASWGQFMIGWETPAWWGANYQRETNLHNYFNPFFPYLYEVAGWICLAWAVAGLWYGLRSEDVRSRRRAWFPPLPLTGLLGVLFLARIWHEVFEELTGLYGLAHGLWLVFTPPPGGEVQRRNPLVHADES